MSRSSETGGASKSGAVDPTPTRGSRLNRGQRLLSLVEFALGGAVVVGYNVYHAVPNEVYILVFIGLISLRLRDGGWTLLGLRWPVSWRRTVLIGLVAAVVRLLLSGLVIEPLTDWLWPPAGLPDGAEAITGDLWTALRWLLLVWTFAALGEEISYRGYLLTRAADVGGRSTLSYSFGVLAVSVLFAIGHYYQGPSGMIDAGMAGIVYGAAYLLSGRNLWVSILAHGLVDTFGVIALYFGWLV